MRSIRFYFMKVCIKLCVSFKKINSITIRFLQIHSNRPEGYLKVSVKYIFLCNNINHLCC